MRKMLLVLLLLTIAMAGLYAGGQKESFPSRNIETIIGFSPGGSTDLAVRGLFDAAGGDLPRGVTFVVSNLTGNAGINGFNKFLSSKSDGYTLGVINIDMAINYNLGRTTVSMADYEPLVLAFYDPYCIVVDNNPNYRTFKEFIEYAKAHPGEIIIGHSGIGAAPHITAVAIEQHFGLSFKYVGYQGSIDAVNAIVSGQVNAVCTQPAPAVSHLKAGNLRMLAFFNNKRNQTWPNVPIATEIYPDFDKLIIAWGIICAKKDTPPEVVIYLQNVLEKARMSEKYNGVLASFGQEPVALPISEATRFLENQYALWGDITKGMKFD